jgi:hypothetical protein
VPLRPRRLIISPAADGLQAVVGRLTLRRPPKIGRVAAGRPPRLDKLEACTSDQQIEAPAKHEIRIQPQFRDRKKPAGLEHSEDLAKARASISDFTEHGHEHSDVEVTVGKRQIAGVSGSTAKVAQTRLRKLALRSN